MKNIYIKIIFMYVIILNIFSSTLLSNSVLVIHGISCSGKTTICHYLQKYFTNSQILSIDNYIWNLWLNVAIKLNIIKKDTPILEKYQLTSKEFSKLYPIINIYLPKTIQKLYIDCEISSKNNPYIILDTAFNVISKNEIHFFLQRLKKTNTFITLAYCSPMTIVQRLIKRNSDIENKFQYRSEFDPLCQFCHLYQPTTFEKSFAILTQQEVKQALDMLKIYLLKDEVNTASILKQITDLQNQFFTHFFPHNEENVHITTEIPYDFFINTEKLTPQEYASIIYQQYVQTKKNLKK
jgi:adenylate kinase family enzyme